MSARLAPQRFPSLNGFLLAVIEECVCVGGVGGVTAAVAAAAAADTQRNHLQTTEQVCRERDGMCTTSLSAHKIISVCKQENISANSSGQKG